MSKVDEYMRKLADLDARESQLSGMSTTEELGYLSQLDALWSEMSADERSQLTRELKGKRVT